MRKKSLFLQKLEHIGHSNAWLPCLNSNYKITHTTHRKLKYGIFCSTGTSLVKVDFILKDNGKKQLGPEKGKRSFLIHHFQCSNQLCLIICGSSPKSIEAYTYPIIQTRLCYQIAGKASIDLYRFSFSSKPQIAQNYERSDIKLRKTIFESNFKSSWDQFESRLALKMITYYFLFEGESRI